MADEANSKGVAAFKSEDFPTALKHFTEAINLESHNHVFYSNRSAAYVRLQMFGKALFDDKMSVYLKPDYVIGLYRLAFAHHLVRRIPEAISAYKKALEFAPSNESLKLGLREAEEAEKSPDLFADDSFRLLVEDAEVNPSIVMSSEFFAIAKSMRGWRDDVDKEVKLWKDSAMRAKEIGNTAYKGKEFERAIKFYSVAVELNDEDISFLTNRAAAFLEMGQYSNCIKDCDKAVERGRELRSDSKMVARALTRKGTALVKMAKMPIYLAIKTLKEAIRSFQEAVTEHENPDTQKKLDDAERAMKELEQHEYYDPELAEKECGKGNEYFKEKKYPYVINNITEALRRSPKNGEAYTKKQTSMAEEATNALFRGNYTEAVQHFTKAINHRASAYDNLENVDLRSDLALWYASLGFAHLRLHQLHEAVSAYKKALEMEPSNKTFRVLLADAEQAKQDANYYSDPSGEKLRQDLAKTLDIDMVQATSGWRDEGKASNEHVKEEEEREVKVTALTRKGTALVEQTSMADAANKKGTSALFRGDYTEAVQHFTEAINHRASAYDNLENVDLRSNLAFEYANLGIAHGRLHQHHEAVSACKKALEMKPSNKRFIDLYADAEQAKQDANYYSDPFGLNTISLLENIEEEDPSGEKLRHDLAKALGIDMTRMVERAKLMKVVNESMKAQQEIAKLMSAGYV